MGALQTPSLLAAVILAACAWLTVVSGGEWSYGGAHGPDNWPGMCKSGKKQSPIDLGSSRVIESDFDTLLLTNYNDTVDGTISNNGHTISIKINEPHQIFLAGGGLNSVYTLTNIHFHWPAEHTIKKASYPLEAHFVHYDVGWKTLGNAIKVKGGIAVLGVLFDKIESQEADIAFLNNVNDYKYNTTKNITFSPRDLLPENTMNFYRYYGSLTTPNCDETVVWTVLSDSRSLSKKQLSNFPKVTDSKGVAMKSNNRPLQEQNNRVLFVNSASSIKNSLVIITTLLIILKSV